MPPPRLKPLVVMLTGSLSPLAGGMFYSGRIPANKMAERGLSPHIIGQMDTLWEDNAGRWRVDAIEALPVIGPERFRMSPKVGERLKSISPDLVHLRGIWGYPSYAAGRWRKRTARPLVISPHGMLDVGGLKLSGAKKRIVGTLYERANLQNASAMHALNAAEAKAIRDFGLTNPIALIPNGVDLPETRSLPKRRSTDETKTLLFLSRIHPKKGIEPLLRAWAMLDDAAPEIAKDWRLQLAGWDDGGHLDALCKLTRELGIDEQVNFPGGLYNEQKAEALASANAFILPSFSEGLPMSILEAWSYGLPVLMTEQCNLPEGFAAGAALRIDNDPAKLARQLEDYLALSDDRLSEIGEAGRAMVAADFSWDSIVDQYLALYDWLHGVAERPEFVTLA
ncbi:MAG: glycosyltransferase [Sphingomonadaceae bacterium]|nr:glycosyltransferase [Sphingomonadaceae bacterium]